MNSNGSSPALTPAQQAAAERTWNAWTKTAPGTGAAPLSFVRVIMGGIKEIVERVINLEMWRQGLDSRSTALDARVTVLEAATAKSADGVGPRDCGAWDVKTVYRTHDGVTFEGGFWIAQRETRTSPHEHSGDWRLAVRRGKQGRDGKPASPESIDERL